jgi:hypothetical protein
MQMMMSIVPHLSSGFFSSLLQIIQEKTVFTKKTFELCVPVWRGRLLATILGSAPAGVGKDSTVDRFKFVAPNQFEKF